MADVQILRADSGAVPIDYKLPDAAELRLRAVYAEFAGSGSAGSWLPCVTILSDSGDVIARAVDQDVAVAAGADADVTFFPGVKHAGAGASELQYPMYEELLHYSSINRPSVAPEYTTNNLLAVPVVDNTYVRGFYADNNGVNGSDVYLPVRLGPHGSQWHVQFVFAEGPDYGKLKIEWGQFVFGEDASPAAGLIDPAGTLESVTLGPGLTFYSVITNTKDFYAAAPAKNQVAGTMSQFRIMGQVGDAVSANGVNDPDTGIQALNGGPGVWYLHLKTDGKRAASAGFRIRLSSIILARESYWNFSVV